MGGEDPLEEIAARADERTTLVIYMGLAALPQLAERLQQRGLPPSLPAVAVMKGTTKEEVRRATRPLRSNNEELNLPCARARALRSVRPRVRRMATCCAACGCAQRGRVRVKGHGRGGVHVDGCVRFSGGRPSAGFLSFVPHWWSVQLCTLVHSFKS